MLGPRAWYCLKGFIFLGEEIEEAKMQPCSRR
jgi:hypothetical protein